MAEETENSLPVIVGIRFSKIGKNYYFDATKIDDLKLGDHLVVETSRGWQLGQLSEIVSDEELRKNASYKSVDRIASPVDLLKYEELNKKAEEALKECQQFVREQKIKDVKIITAEFSFDEKILSFLFTCESEETPNLNQLKKSIGKKYSIGRIDFHKIGPRDVAKFYGGMGACGFPTRCCTKFLNQFDSISIRMAKTQGISLTPSDITGMCDRLRCCLSYEHCQYVEALKNMPKRNKVVMTPNGQGKIKDIAPLRECVYVQLDEIGIKEFHISQIEEAKAVREDRRQLNQNSDMDNNSNSNNNHSNDGQSSRRRRNHPNRKKQ
jgi:cell fate regulator YaaT (PSP1 superfamily)